MFIPKLNRNEILFGVYICVEQPWGAYVKKQRLLNGDNLADLVQSHITLLPPTAIDKKDLNTFLSDLKAMADNAKPFWITLNGSDNFRPVSEVSFIKLQRGQAQCEKLHNKICASFPIGKQRFPFHAHVTLSHNLQADKTTRIQQLFSNFNASFLCTKIYVDVLEKDGNSNTMILLPLNGAK